MSPTEDDLRAALRVDEPPAPSAASLIGLAHQARRERRRNVLYGAASMCAVLVVAAIAWGAHNLGTTKVTASTSVASRPELAAGGAADAAVAPATDCPGFYSSLTSSASPQPQTAPVFEPDIVSMTLCLYTGDAGSSGNAPIPFVTSVVLDAAEAATRAAIINSGPVDGRWPSCAATRTVTSVLVLSSYRSGAAGRATLDLCDGAIFSESGAERYVPDQVTSLLDLVNVAASRSTAGTSLSNPVSGVPMSHGPGPS